MAKDIERNMYVDNLISGVSTSGEGRSYYEKTKQIFNDASMNMCQWASNDTYLMSKIQPEDKRTDNFIKVLCMIWKLDVDELYFTEMKFKLGDDLSKRKMLQVLAAIYDPLGLFCPALIEPKGINSGIMEEKSRVG